MSVAEAIRVVVAESSPTILQALAGLLERSSEFVVVGRARSGQEAIDLCRELRPDVLSMGVDLPQRDEATEQIMAHFPTPILIICVPPTQNSPDEAIAAGAVDSLEMPPLEQAGKDSNRYFLHTLRLVSNVKVITHPRGRLAKLSSFTRAKRSGLAQPSPKSPDVQLLAVGGSTGGPGAMAEILRGLPGDLEVPILVVLHTSEPFGEGLASWLNSQSPLPVRYAKDSETLAQVRGVVMAPPGKHLLLRGSRLQLTLDPERYSCRPSVDVLFESLVPDFGPRTCACLLTGMGKDGARGLLALRRAGAITIAQDEATSVVYGMPREAVILGAAGHVSPLNQISRLFRELVQGNSARRVP